MSPAEKAARDEMAERKMQKATDKAYMGSLRNTEANELPNFKPMFDKVKAKARAESKMPKTDEMGSPTGYKKGGSASSRADGCAVKGKTKGRMI
jgi:hypothetical protein